MDDKLNFLINFLLDEMPAEGAYLAKFIKPEANLLRALMNIRLPKELDPEFLRVQDEYLRVTNESKGIVNVNELDEILPGISLWQGDITRLNADAIVNAANEKLLGCFIPCHKCIDNAIHSAAGLQLRDECNKLMQAQGHDEETGRAKITRGYNLPAKHVIHTVGPIVSGKLKDSDCVLLEDCYKSCLELADENKLENIAFCCISTGEFHFPNDVAAEIAVNTVKNFLPQAQSLKKVIFNVFKDLDLEIYRRLLES